MLVLSIQHFSVNADNFPESKVFIKAKGNWVKRGEFSGYQLYVPGPEFLVCPIHQHLS